MMMPLLKWCNLFWLVTCTGVLVCNCCWALHPDENELQSLRSQVKEMFYHAYEGYLKYAYPLDELRPLTCDGVNTWGSYSLTLVDALDTLAVMGNYTEFRRVANLLIDNLHFNIEVNASVFESNIRVVGGLISAHLLSKKAGMDLDPGWPCSGPLLRLATDLAYKLLPAFDTKTGMPFGTVNLLNGVDPDETPITCTAGVATYIVEFGALSRLTGDRVFEDVAMKAIQALDLSKSPIGLVGNHINISNAKWTALDAGIGAGVDSFYEYLVKGAILLERPELMGIFKEHLGAINQYLKHGDWYMWASKNTGKVTMPVHQSLAEFWPGLQTLYGDVESAYKTILNYYHVWRKYGASPEFYSVTEANVVKDREGYPLRPELIESTMYLYRATKDPLLLEFGKSLLRSIETVTRTKCGYSTIKQVTQHLLENRMESFFLAETLKYLYLLFDPDHYVHKADGSGAYLHRYSNGRECLLGAGGYIFNTEAHPIDVSAVQCCNIQQKTFPQDDLDLADVLVDYHSRKTSSLWLSDDFDVVYDDNLTEILRGQNTSYGWNNMKCDLPPLLSKLSIQGQIFSGD